MTGWYAEGSLIQHHNTRVWPCVDLLHCIRTQRVPAILLKAHLPAPASARQRAVLALWVEGTLLGLNGCQDTVTLALAHGLRGARNPHTLRRLQRELLYDDADRIDSWGPGQELEVERCFAPLLQWVRSWWVPTGGRELAQEPLVLALAHGRAGAGVGAAGAGLGSYLQAR